MRRLVAPILCCWLALSVGCHKAAPVVEPGPTDWPGATPLTEAEIGELQIPDGLLPLLPYGRGTPVLRVRSDPQTLQGFSFSVGVDGISVTIHALRRQIIAHEFKVRPLVYGVRGPDTALHDGVTLLFHGTEAIALKLAMTDEQQPRVQEVSQLLDQWRPSTRMSLLAIGDQTAWVEVEHLPGGEQDQPLGAALAEVMSDNVDPKDILQELGEGNSVPLDL